MAGPLRRQLRCHADTPPASIEMVEVELTRTSTDDMSLIFTVTPGNALAVPEPSLPGRMDGLWQRTCCELFLKPEGSQRYFEFNLSPTGQWAAYAFDGYRSGVRDLPLATAPQIATERRGGAFVIEAEIDLAAISPGRLRLGLSAVIEEVDGTKSYWALRHPAGKPDFHHSVGFALALPFAR